jgi:hypothetical protein
VANRGQGTHGQGVGRPVSGAAVWRANGRRAIQGRQPWAVIMGGPYQAAARGGVGVGAARACVMARP